jgi:hypothetical protein
MCFSSNNGVRKCTFSTGGGKTGLVRGLPKQENRRGNEPPFVQYVSPCYPACALRNNPGRAKKKLLFAKFRSGNAQINLAFSPAYSTLAAPKLLPLGKMQASLLLPSLIRTFGSALDTSASGMLK